MLNGPLEEGLTFDDVLLVPAKSEVHPREVDVSTGLTRNIRINIPLVSAAMDTVTETRLAIALAREGGIGMIHRAFSPERQAAEVDKVKKSESGMIMDPITVRPTQMIYEALEFMEHYRISGVPVTDEKGRLVGILTNRDLRFETKLDLPIAGVMTRDRLVTAPVGTSLEEAKEILHQNRIEKLPVVDEHFMLRGLITIKDIEKRRKYPSACKDPLGRLRVGAAVGVEEDAEVRVSLLLKAGVDVIYAERFGVVEAAAERVILIAQSQVPLADQRRVIAGLLEHLRQEDRLGVQVAPVVLIVRADHDGPAIGRVGHAPSHLGQLVGRVEGVDLHQLALVTPEGTRYRNE